MPRVDEVAKELNLTPDEVRTRLSAMGEPVDGDSTEISESSVERLRADLETGDAAAKEGDPLGAPTGSLAVDGVTGGDRKGEATQVVRSPTPPPTSKVEAKQPMRKVLRGIAELPILIVVAFLIAVLIKTFLVQAFFIPSGSMEDTLRVGDRVLVEKISYFVGDPARGQVVVFARSVFGAKREDVPWYKDVQNYFRELLGLPTGKEEDYIKRIVAVGGDTIRYSGRPRQLLVNGEAVEEDYIKNGVDRQSETLTRADCRGLKMSPSAGGCRVPAGKVFVMGDNRVDSQDSRVIGPIDEDKIIGRAFLIIWPPGDFGTI
jgi:signal peptidase I